MQLSIPKIPEPLVIWEKIEILTSLDDTAGLYVARIEDFENEGLLITQPEFIKGETLLRDKCPVILRVTKSDAVYHFESTIQKKDIDGFQKFFLSNPVFKQRIQRREFARLVYSTPLEYTVYDEKYKNNQQWYKSYSWDISGNGILFEVKDFVKQHTALLLKIDLFNELDIQVPILGLSQRILLDNKTRLCGLSFVTSDQFQGFEKKHGTHHIKNLEHNFDLQAQEKLVSFVFQQQLSQRKKGLL